MILQDVNRICRFAEELLVVYFPTYCDTSSYTLSPGFMSTMASNYGKKESMQKYGTAGKVVLSDMDI